MKIDNLNTSNKYKIIYADPPWSYRAACKAMSYTAAHHYYTMSVAEIAQLPINSITTDDAVCFMWATFPTLANALEVLRAWGFEYKTAAFVWVKKNKKSNSNFWGMGQYTRANAEVVLLGTKKGFKPLRDIQNHAIHQIVEAPVGKHSSKPPIIRELITKLLGEDVPRIELFARENVDGWDCWGEEAPE